MPISAPYAAWLPYLKSIAFLKKDLDLKNPKVKISYHPGPDIYFMTTILIFKSSLLKNFIGTLAFLF